MSLHSLALAVVLALAPALAVAAPLCPAPSNLSPAPVEPVPPSEIQRGVTTAYYLLALSWSPEWCRTNGQGSTSQRLQCGGSQRGFILHGLWPNGAAPPYPRYCKPVGAIDAKTVRDMFCRTPSPTLLQHEWQAHGSCGWNDSKTYFDQAAALYDRIVMPRIESIDRNQLTAGAVRRAFVRANRGLLEPEGIFVVVDRGGRLTEVRLCHDLNFLPSRCRGGTGTPDRIALRLTPTASRRF